VDRRKQDEALRVAVLALLSSPCHGEGHDGRDRAEPTHEEIAVELNDGDRGTDQPEQDCGGS
jgi:hypothetical protein